MSHREKQLKKSAKKTVSTTQLKKKCRNTLFTNSDNPVTNANVGNTSLTKKEKYTHRFVGESGITKLINRQNAMKTTSTTKKGRAIPTNSAQNIRALVNGRTKSTSRLSALFRLL